MAASLSRSKGKRGEATVAKTLSSYFSLTFIRTPYSGAFVGGRNSKRSISKNAETLLSGDLIPPEELQNIYCEVKNGKMIGLWMSILRGNSIFIDPWLKQCRESKKAEGAVPVIFFYRDREPIFCVIEKAILKSQKPIKDWIQGGTYITYTGNDGVEIKDYIITKLSNILTEDNRQSLENLFKTR